MSYCGEQTLVKRVGLERRAVSLRCRAWTCPDCADNRKRQLIAQAIGGSPCLFLTLTMRRHHVPTPIDAAKKLARCWRIVRLRLMRRYGWRKLPFLAVFEPHKSGWPHLHILCRSAFIDIGFVRACMAELADSPQADIEWIDNKGRVAGYCAKYCSKGTAKFGTCKRYWQSQDFDLREKPDRQWKWKNDPAIDIVPSQLAKLALVYDAQGWSVVWTSGWSAIFKPPPARSASQARTESRSPPQPPSRGRAATALRASEGQGSEEASPA